MHIYLYPEKGFWGLWIWEFLGFAVFRIPGVPGAGAERRSPRVKRPPKTFQDEAFFGLTFSYTFWTQLNVKRPPKTTPFGDPNRPKIAPRRVLRALFSKTLLSTK